MNPNAQSKEQKAHQRSGPHLGTVIACSSGKGGVGKSTVAVNLACTLAKFGKKVGLLDADFHGPSIPMMLGVTDVPEIRKGEGGADRLIPPEAHGVKVLSMGVLVDPDEPLIWRGPMLHNTLSQFVNHVEWGELDYLIVDMPPGTGDIQISLAQLMNLSGALLITTPQSVSVQDVRKAFAMWTKVGVPVLGFIENMSTFVCDGCEKRHRLFGQGGGYRLSEKYGAPLMMELPFVEEAGRCSDLGTPLCLSRPESAYASDFQSLARKIMGSQAPQMEGPEIGSFQ